MKFLLLVLLFSCTSKQPSQPTQPQIPNENSTGIHVRSYKNFPESFLPKMKMAVAKTEEIKKSQCFKDFMMSRKLIQTNDLTNDQVIFSLINTSAEIDLSYYSRWSPSKTVGYTYDNSPVINVNGYYQRSWGVCDVAANFGHESSHKQGFGHDYNWTPERQFSVPYSVGEAISFCCK